MAHFVLIHGAWHGSWCWEAIATRLIAAGHVVSAPDLPCHGDDQSPIWAATLGKYAKTALLSALSSSEPPLLVGHSLGGLVITEAAARYPERFAGLIYLCAFAPLPGDRLIHLARADRSGGVPAAVRQGLTRTSFQSSRAAEIFYHQCDPAAQAQAIARLRAEPNWPSFQKVSAPQGALPPRLYLECLEDRAISPSHQRWMRDRAGIEETISIATDHSPFLSTPDDLTTKLMEAAERLGRQAER